MRKIRRAVTVVAIGTSVAMGVVLPAIPAAVAAPSQPTLKIVASGLNSPKHLLWTRNGVYVAESGTGGTDCITAPSVEGQGTTQYCVGDTASVDLVSRRGVKHVLTGLPSVIEKDSMTATGPAAVALNHDSLVVLYQDSLVQADGSTALPAPFSGVGGKALLASRAHNTWTPAVDFAAYAAAHPQDAATLGGLGETVYDSDPYDITRYKDGYAVVDAAANSLLYVDKQGTRDAPRAVPDRSANRSGRRARTGSRDGSGAGSSHVSRSRA